MRPLSADITSNTPGGQWQVFVYPDERSLSDRFSPTYDVTFFRGAPSQVLSKSTQDPFGPAAASVKFPRITYFDRKGVGDLWWLIPEANVDLCWVVGDRVAYVWEGYIASFEHGEVAAGQELTITCQGAAFQLDNYLAKPEYLYAPIPFEYAIARQLMGRPDLRLAPLWIEWPEWWTTTYAPDPATFGRPWMQPSHVTQGQKWSGMVTRDTGSWSQVLTGYIQTLLGSMQTDRGQFTLMLDPGRAPVLRHRDRLSVPDDKTLKVDLLWPGVGLSFAEDHSQKLNTVFVSGRSLSGASYTGMRVSNDGRTTMYKPFAARRNVHPPTDNPQFLASVMRREVQLTAPDGMSPREAEDLAKSHLQRYASPGITGTLTLKVDPFQGQEPFPRQAIQAGMSVALKGLFGSPNPAMFHITEESMSEDGTVNLTIDSRYRDALTVQEVRLRGRDALTPTRLLTTGSWQPNIPDLLFPWSYEMGAGAVPFAGDALFREMDTHEEFPWRNWVKAHPPKDPRWRDRFIRIGPKNAVADKNWSAYSWDGENTYPHPVLLSAAGSSRLVEIAAYDADGNVLAVPFHVSLWNSNVANASAGPVIPTGGFNGYPSGQHNPFFPGAWETVDDNGVVQNPDTPQAEGSASIIVGWGNGYEKAGYWPGQSSTPGAAPTGLFRDETPFSWDLTSVSGGVNPQEPSDINTADVSRASVYVLIYCDAQAAKEVFFLGRIYRAEPGST